MSVLGGMEGVGGQGRGKLELIATAGAKLHLGSQAPDKDDLTNYRTAEDIDAVVVVLHSLLKFGR